MVLRELFVKLGLDVDAQSFAKGMLAAEAAKLALGYVAGAALEAATAITSAGVSLVEAMNTSIDKIDTAADGAARWRTAAEAAGVPTKALDAALAHAGKTSKDVNGDFLRTADEVAAIADEGERSRIAVAKFGKSGEALVPLLAKGSDEIRRMSGAITDISSDSITASQDVRAALANMGPMWRAVFTPLLPAITYLVKRYREWRRENDEITRQRIVWVMDKLVRAVKWLWQAMQPLIAAAKRVGESLQYIGRMAIDAAKAIYERLVRAFEALKVKAKAALDYLISHFDKVKQFVGEHGLQLALAGLAIAFNYLGVAGTLSALKTAAAWGLATLKFVALAALLGAIYLAFDDIATYEESIRRGGTGKNTMFGKWKGEIDKMVDRFKEWMKPSGEDPWWLKAIKKLVGYLEQTYGVLDKLHLTKPGERQYVDPNTLSAKALRAAGVSDPAWVGTNPGMTWRPEGEPVKNLFMGSDSMLADALKDLWPGSRTEYSPTPSAAAPITDNSRTEIVVHAAPGQSAEEIGNHVLRRVREEREEWWDGKMEAAGAATGE